MKWGYRIGIQGKFAVSLFIVGLLPGIVALFFTYAFTKKTIHNAIGTNFQELAREAAREVDAFLQREVEDAWNISIAPPVIEAVEKGVPLASAAAYLKIVQRRREAEYEQITLYDRFDKPLVSTAPGSEILRPARMLKTGEHASISDLYRREGVSDDLLDISVPVLDERGRRRGTVTLTVRFDEIYESILGVKVGKTGHAMLVSSEGTPLVCPILPPKKHLLNDSLMSMISQTQPGWAIAGDDGHGGRDSIIGFAPVSAVSGEGADSFGGIRWYTFVRQDPKETYSPLYILLGNVATIGLSLVALLSLFGLYVSATIVRPIRALQRWTESAASRETVHSPEQTLDALERIKTGDEIEDLAGAFMRMTLAQVEYQRRLVRSEKLVAIGQLAAVVAHEIRNPLNAILGAATLLKDDVQGTDRAARTIDLMVLEIGKLNQFVSDLLTLVQDPVPRKSAIEFPPLIEEVLHLLELQGRLEGIRVVREFSGQAPKVMVDPGQIRQVLLNLVSNALDAMPEGGTLRLGIRSGRGPEGIGFWISDTGQGISAQDQERLFEPFFTTREKGIGLGLTICRTILEKHGGKISIDSRFGEGTTVTLEFPTEGAAG